tara:strand:+ start:199 stop:873 length:675 start_codon:yes stop_codon:yes gene_type:complete
MHTNNERLEKKWIFENNTMKFDNILISLIRSKFNFKQHYENRFINSIYFDNKNLSCVKDNLDGEKNRRKYRLRWYGSSKVIQNPYFEIKSKSGLTSNKNRIKINLKNNIKFNDHNVAKLSDIINKKIVLNKFLVPKILISYERTYLISSDNLIRATLDKNIKFKKLNFNSFGFFSNLKKIILEIKYTTDLDKHVRSLLNEIPVRYSKSSKYIQCMLMNSREFVE